MGIIVAKFKRKKTTYDILEKLENEIKAIEEFGRDTEQRQKKMVGRFIFVSVFAYFVSALIFYFYFFPAKLTDRIIYIVPLILLPLVILFIKKILTWYYNRKLRKNEKQLISLKEQKKKILDEVMDKETYKVAKTILEKFAPEQVKKPDYSVMLAGTTPLTAATPQSNQRTQQTPGLRYRFPLNQTPLTSQQQRILPTPGAPTPLLSTSQTTLTPSVQRSTPASLPRSILPKERSFIDKMVDYLVGDGPSNRYALICQNCSGHNGMALKEEFDYLSFRCCYCAAFNPARKQRPSAPSLEFGETIRTIAPDTQTNSTSEEEAEVDGDDDKENESDGSRSESPPIITEISDDEQKPNENKTNTESLEIHASVKEENTEA